MVMTAKFNSAAGVMAGQQNSGGPPLKCPRCDSNNTKFCYYNNYSLSQPRHFCKACKRYWTRGGTLRNVPVGGGCRKNKRHNKPNPTAAKIPSADIDPTKSLQLPPLQPLPPANSNGFFFPGFDLDLQLVGYEEPFKSGISGHLPDLRQPAPVGIYSFLNSQLGTSSSSVAETAAAENYLPWVFYDDFPAMSVGNDQNLLEGMNSLITTSDSSSAFAGKSPYLYLNQTVGAGWSSYLASDAIVSSTDLQARSG